MLHDSESSRPLGTDIVSQDTIRVVVVRDRCWTYIVNKNSVSIDVVITLGNLHVITSFSN